MKNERYISSTENEMKEDISSSLSAQLYIKY